MSKTAAIRALFVALVVLAAVCSIPFFRWTDVSWAQMNPYLQGLTFSLAAALFCQAYLSSRLRNTLLLLMVSVLVSWAAEAIGIRWAWPFSGRYNYNPAIGPSLPGDVPLCIPVTWFMLAYTALVFTGPLSIRPRGFLSPGRLLLKTTLCALFVMAADFAIDPLAVKYGAWSWHVQGAYFGVPLGNYAGWFIVAYTICGLSLILEKPRPRHLRRNHIALDKPFVAASISLTMICFAGSFLRVGSVLPVALSLTFMGMCWLFWLVSAGRPGVEKQIQAAAGFGPDRASAHLQDAGHHHGI